eukprot:NODE_6298_length_1684_cov_15.834297.p1 GENE.NODE_6298_length_1684_cov_15.834297~~NODE_6298_length_1684_cov_15.834297.p1  ORF type:complete len:461 (+),score=188.63 NODE_6298_length_1684_cov_15.834297:73-1455(+)
MEGGEPDPFLKTLQDPDLYEKIASNPQTRVHLADPGYADGVRKLQDLANSPKAFSADFLEKSAVSSDIARAAHNDPRLMQLMMMGAGCGLTIEEKDLKHAESVGDMPRREPVQLAQLELVRDLKDGDEAKAKGNEHFKRGDYASALAHYEKGIELLKASGDAAPVAAYATLFSNAALCFLKLKWPDRAKKQASMAIAVLRKGDDTTFDQSKLFYRRALACEMLKELSMGVDDMARALQHAKRSNLSLTEQHRLKGEIDRLKRLKTSHEAHIAKKEEQAANEKVAEVQRMQGAKMKEVEEASAIPTDQTYIQERDFSHWTRRKLEQALIGVTHKAENGARVEVVSIDEGSSKIQASVTMKRGQRSLFYDLDLKLNWKGKAATALKPNDGPGEMDGIMRLYNIAHDTKFELGGDENTSYIYMMGYNMQLSGEWVENLKLEAPELFDILAAKIDGVLLELRQK